MILIEHAARHFDAPAPATRWAWRRGTRRLAAVRDISLQAADGAITGLLGPNGAGKTTTLRMLAGLLPPDPPGGPAEEAPAGPTRLWVDEHDVQRAPTAARERLGLLGDARGLSPRLTARENIVYYGRLHGLSPDAAQSRAEALAEQLDFRALLDRPTAGFSQGERMKTALARALVHDPANIVLDEPTNGLDVVATRALRESLRHLRSAAGGRKCIVVSTHIMQEVERLCDHVVVVSAGRTVAAGSIDALKQRSGRDDFEEAFVALAYGPEALAPERPPYAADGGRT